MLPTIVSVEMTLAPGDTEDECHWEKLGQNVLKRIGCTSKKYTYDIVSIDVLNELEYESFRLGRLTSDLTFVTKIKMSFVPRLKR